MGVIHYRTRSRFKQRAIARVVRKSPIYTGKREVEAVLPSGEPVTSFTPDDVKAEAEARAVLVKKWANSEGSFSQEDIAIGIKFGINKNIYERGANLALGIIGVGVAVQGETYSVHGSYYVPWSLADKILSKGEGDGLAICDVVKDVVAATHSLDPKNRGSTEFIERVLWTAAHARGIAYVGLEYTERTVEELERALEHYIRAASSVPSSQEDPDKSAKISESEESQDRSHLRILAS